MSSKRKRKNVSPRYAGISRVSAVVLGFGFVGSRVSGLRVSVYARRGAEAAAITTLEGWNLP
jgi:hypothetical protein